MTQRRLIFGILFGCWALLVLLMLTGQASKPTAARRATGPCTIVLDAGHGGGDPGAIGVAGTREDDINLKITLYLKAELEKRGHTVLLTRSEDAMIAENKNADMRKRREIISQSGADYAISIHLNSNTDRSCRGPVAIYQEQSQQGKQIAQLLQQTLNEQIAPPKPRQVQSGNYYILKSGAMPIVIVECGFLSNAEEEQLLLDDAYQQKIAAAIADGMQAYIDQP